MRWRGWILILLLTFFSGLMVRITLPYLSLDTHVAFLQIKQWVIHHDVWRISFFTHVFSSIFLLMAGFTQFHNPFQGRMRTVHRWIGKMYVLVLLLFSAPAGLVMSLYANGGLLSQSAFTLLSVLWIYTTLRAYVSIRQRKFIEHSDWMLRSFALTLSALTLRAWKYVLVLLFHPHPVDAYQLVAWLGWVPNLLIAEWLIRTKWSKKRMTPASRTSS
jgi:Predicted membrane protein (DUF2306)